MQLSKNEKVWLDHAKETDIRESKMLKIINVLLARIDMLYEERHNLNKKILELSLEVNELKSNIK